MVFKTAIAILETLQEELIVRKFEEIMALLTSQHTHSASTAIYTDIFLARIGSIKVTTSLLRALESEYEHVKLRAINPRARN